MLRQRRKRIDELKQEIKVIEDACTSQIEFLVFNLGKGRHAQGSELRECLQSIPGVGTWTAIVWLSEVGDIDRFPTVNRLIAYAGLDPSEQISAGKVVSTKVRKGNKRLYNALRNVARAMLSSAPTCVFSVWARA